MDTLSIRCHPVAGSSPITPKKCSRWLDYCFLFVVLVGLLFPLFVVLVGLLFSLLSWFLYRQLERLVSSSLTFKFPQLAGEGSAGEELVIEDSHERKPGGAVHTCVSVQDRQSQGGPWGLLTTNRPMRDQFSKHTTMAPEEQHLRLTSDLLLHKHTATNTHRLHSYSPYSL